MSSASETVFQAGIESTKGTAVAATRKLYCVAELPVEDDNVQTVQQARDNYMANFDAVQTHRLGKWKMEQPANYKDLMFWFQLMLKGGVAASGAGPYTWTFNGAAASDDLDAMTLEAGDDVVALEVPYTLCGSWELSGADGNGPGLVNLKGDFVGTKKVDTTLTGAISDVDMSGAYLLFKNAAVYLDDTAGGIGSTEVAALMAFSLKCDNKIQPNFPGNAGGIFTSHNRDKRFVEVQLDLLLNSATYTEFTDHYVGGDARFGQISITGIGNYDFSFNFHVARWHKFEPKASGPTRRVVLIGQTVYDPTLGYDWQTVVTNDEATL